MLDPTPNRKHAVSEYITFNFTDGTTIKQSRDMVATADKIYIDRFVIVDGKVDLNPNATFVDLLREGARVVTQKRCTKTGCNNTFWVTSEQYKTCEEHRRMATDTDLLKDVTVDQIRHAARSAARKDAAIQRYIDDHNGEYVCFVTNTPLTLTNADMHHIIPLTAEILRLQKNHPEMTVADALDIVNNRKNIVCLLSDKHRDYEDYWAKDNKKAINMATLLEYKATINA